MVSDISADYLNMWHQNRIDALDSSSSPTSWRNPVYRLLLQGAECHPKESAAHFRGQTAGEPPNLSSGLLTVSKRRGNPGHGQILNRNCQDGKWNQKDVLFLFTASSIWHDAAELPVSKLWGQNRRWKNGRGRTFYLLSTVGGLWVIRPPGVPNLSSPTRQWVFLSNAKLLLHRSFLIGRCPLAVFCSAGAKPNLVNFLKALDWVR